MIKDRNYLVRTLRKLVVLIARSVPRRPPSETIAMRLRERAISSSAQFAEENLSGAMAFLGQQQIRQFALDSAIGEENLDGKLFLLEFGVWEGESMRFWSAGVTPSASLVGFDSFEGLSQAWPGTDMGAGHFSLDGRLPDVAQNVTLIKGWVEDTLEHFLKNSDVSAVRLVHMDLDIYEPTLFVLKKLKPLLTAGTLILFDEYFGFPFWQVGEHRALQDSGLDFEYVAYTSGGTPHPVDQVLIRVL